MSHDPSASNRGGNNNGLGQTTRTRIHNITGLEVQKLLAKLDVLLRHLPELPFEEPICDSDYDAGEKTGKHVLQEVSILGHLRKIGALTSSDVASSLCQKRRRKRAIELGAGTGRLSDRLQRVTNAEWDHVLIDRRDFEENHCRDRILRARAKKAKKEVVIQRAVADIASLNLDEYCTFNEVTQTYDDAVCLSKHLCGPACDLTISALGRMAAQPLLPPSSVTADASSDATTADTRRRRRPPPGAIATCCHYLCTWESFAGRNFWSALGLDEEEFLVATTASQWASMSKKKRGREDDQGTMATIGTTEEANVAENNSNVATHDRGNDDIEALPNLLEQAKKANEAWKAYHETNNNTESFVPSEKFERTFAREDKATFGQRLKRLLDLGRAAGLQEMGYDVRLVRYTTRSIEDRLLVMMHRPSSSTVSG